MAQQQNRTKWLPFPLIVVVAGLLLTGLWAGLARLGVAGVRTDAAPIHGTLMISGVLGTLISLERTVALTAVLRSRWRWLAYLAPLLTAIGGVILVSGMSDVLARSSLLLGSLGLVGISVVIVRQHPSADSGIMALGAVALLVGNGLLLLEQPLYLIVHWWIAFLILTIVGERLELSRIVRITAQQRNYLLAIIAVYLGSLTLTTISLSWGTRLAGLSQILLALWLLRYDIARTTIRRTGLPRYIAACLLSGYVWLGIGGVISLWQGALYAGLYYEALLHSLLLGFVFSMIFGHAPIIIPALTSRPVRFHRVLYLPLLLLHSSLLLRIVSILSIWMPGRQWGGILNVISILLFMGLMLSLVLLGNVQPDKDLKQHNHQ